MLEKWHRKFHVIFSARRVPGRYSNLFNSFQTASGRPRGEGPASPGDLITLSLNTNNNKYLKFRTCCRSVAHSCARRRSIESKIYEDKVRHLASVKISLKTDEVMKTSFGPIYCRS